MARTAHQAIGEFYLRPPIAGLKVLSGQAAAQAAFETPSPANGRTVLAALRALVEGESVYNGLHKTDLFLVRNLVKTLEPISAVAGPEAGNSAAEVAALVRTALQNDANIGGFFDITGATVDVILTAKVRAANDATMNAAYDNGSSAGLTPDTTSTDTTAGVAPVAQVETATVAGGATASANVIVTVTAAGMTGSPKAINVAVVNLDSADTVAGKIRTALAADGAVTALFTVSGATDKVILTRTTPAGVANDATLNIAIDGTTNGTGVPDAASSAHTTAGVAGTKQVETMTIVGTPTVDGAILVTVTAAGMTGSPRAIAVIVNGSQGTDVIITDAVYAAAKAAGGSAAGDDLRAALVLLAADYIPGFTGVNITNAGRF